MPRVYLETSVVSYLTAVPRLGRDPVTAAHQQISIEWWARRRQDFDLVISQVVLDEAQEGDPAAARSRLEFVSGLQLLAMTTPAMDLARAILVNGLLPQKALRDALHIAVATVHEIEYLLTWNCKHIANAEVLPRIARLGDTLGLTLPTICTPEELLGVANDH